MVVRILPVILPWWCTFVEWGAHRNLRVVVVVVQKSEGLVEKVVIGLVGHESAGVEEACRVDVQARAVGLESATDSVENE